MPQPDQQTSIVCADPVGCEHEHVFAHADDLDQLAAEAQTYQAALCELHRAVTDHDGSDCDEARLLDAIGLARRLAPYEPVEPDPDGF